VATSRYQVPAIPAGDAGTGPYFSSDTHNDGVQTVHKDKIVICDAAGNIVDSLTTAPAGTERGIVTRPITSGTQAVQGGPLVTTSGTITTATSAVTSGDVGVYNNVTVVISGTYAGVNVIFEVSPDAGTTWVPVVGSRLDGTGTESTSGVLAANSTRGWEFTLPAVNRFRVRATAWTSGTANVIIAAGTMPLEPVVNSIYSPPPSRTMKSVYLEGLAGVNADTIISTLGVVTTPGTAPTTGQTSIPVTAGKTFRITSLSFSIYVTTATTPPWLRIRLRFNPSGAGAIGSNQVASWTVGPNNTTLNAAGVHPVALPPEGIELTASATANGGFAFSISGPVTTPGNCALNMQLHGYEF
jgi:hypothetical protein